MKQSQLKQLIKGIIREVIGMDVKPPYQNVDADTEKEIALKSPFTAISYLMQHNNINLATHEFDKILKGTPFQRTYESWLAKMHGREVRESKDNTCPQCKGQGHHEMTLKDRSGRNNNGMGNVHTVPCSFPGCHGGKVDREENYHSFGIGPCPHLKKEEESPFGMNRRGRRDLSQQLAAYDDTKDADVAKDAAHKILSKTNPTASYKIGAEKRRQDLLKSLGK